MKMTWEQFEEQVQGCLNQKHPVPVFSGRGIVTCAGGIKYTVNAYVMIRLLRSYGCDLPVEWFYAGDELEPIWKEAIEEIPNVKCINLDENAKGWNGKDQGGWQMKPRSIMASSFNEVLFLDADSFPYKNPEFIFDVNDTAIFWGDICRWDTKRFNNCYTRLLKVGFKPGMQFESGQMVINKTKCWDALNLCKLYNEMSELMYQIVYGDKDTFYFAWRRTDTTFHLIKKAPDMGYAALIQYDMNGEKLFCHCTGSKWNLNGRPICDHNTFPDLDKGVQFVKDFQRGIGWSPMAKSLV